jgi:hypothetical protein
MHGSFSVSCLVQRAVLMRSWSLYHFVSPHSLANLRKKKPTDIDPQSTAQKGYSMITYAINHWRGKGMSTRGAYPLSYQIHDVWALCTPDTEHKHHSRNEPSNHYKVCPRTSAASSFYFDIDTSICKDTQWTIKVRHKLLHLQHRLQQKSNHNRTSNKY